MNPIYKFMLSIDGENAKQAFPVYKDDLAIDFAQESGQQFFRRKLNGKITFQNSDYTRIHNAAFDAEFCVEILISYNGGQTWASYWVGAFWKTDCEFNDDNETVVVSPTVKDAYVALLAGMDKEYNLIDLKPAINKIRYDKRPMIQVYVPGQTTIGCFLSGMWWEQECEAITDVDALKNTYLFAPVKGIIDLRISGESTPAVPEHVVNYPDVSNLSGIVNFQFDYGQYTFVRYLNSIWISPLGNISTKLWVGNIADAGNDYTVELEPGVGTTGTLTMEVSTRVVFARYVCDVEQAGSTPTYALPESDIVPNNRNYTRAVGYQFPETIIFSDVFSETPTQWGLYEPGRYYVSPSDYTIPGIGKCFPIARNTWGGLSIWFTAATMDAQIERLFRKEMVLNDAFPLWSVISVLLAQVAPGITHENTTDYSLFLYSTTNPVLSYIEQTLFITPKSNIVFGGYDQPAQKAPITLKRVLDMLRDCFRCYCFIDEQDRFRIEHISWFIKGGTYTGQPIVGRDLTQEIVTRNGKSWSFARNEYKFDKPEMAARYQFGWMDDATELFDGQPIDIVSKYVNPDNIENVDVQQFSSDIDYILLNPSEISKDGFVLLAAKRDEILDDQFEINSLGIAVISNNITDDWKNGFIRIEYSFSNGTGKLFAIGTDTSRSWDLENSGVLEIQLPQDTDTVRIQYGQAGETVDVRILETYKLPYMSFVLDNASFILQNAYVAFVLLQSYYRYDMPAKVYKIGGTQYNAIGIKKLKTQEINFPVLEDPNIYNLIKTELGKGAIQKMSVNLSSRNAKTTLKYDTDEQ